METLQLSQTTKTHTDGLSESELSIDESCVEEMHSMATQVTQFEDDYGRTAFDPATRDNVGLVTTESTYVRRLPAPIAEKQTTQPPSGYFEMQIATRPRSIAQPTLGSGYIA